MIQNLTIALFIGALVGTERAHHTQDEAASFAGLRTFMLFAELGAVCAWISNTTGSMAVFLVGLGCVTAVVVAGYVVENRPVPKQPGLTTETAAIIVYLLGGATVLGHAGVAVAVAIATSGFLALKARLHEAVQRISTAELLAALRLLFASFIVLPLLPHEAIDPWHALSPYKLWLLVVLISALSMVGYVAVRILGQARGTAVTGFFGGLVSSTAVTLAFARRSKEEPQLSAAFATGVLLAWSVMSLRVLVLVAVIDRPLVARLLAPMLAMAAVAGLVATYEYLRSRRQDSTPESSPEVSLKSPFQLRSAIKFAVVFAAVLVVVQVVRTHAPPGGLYAVAGLAGMTDVDPITLSMAELSQRGEIVRNLAAVSIVIAAISNTLVKLGLCAVFGSRRLAARLALATLVLCGSGVLALALT